MDDTRNQLKNMNRQYSFYTEQKTAMKNNLIALLDQTFPGANAFFDSPARSDGSQKWVDFVYTYWHVDCVRGKSLRVFTEHYKNWCHRKGYNFSAAKVEEIYNTAADLIAVFPKDDTTKLLIQQAVTLLNTASQTVESLRTRMNQTAATLPEYPAVMAMNGVGPTFGPQLMAEIGDIRNFPRRSALVGFAGIDPEVDDSGKDVGNRKPATKRGSPHLRKTLFQIMTTYLRLAPQDEPVYQFLDKKRSEGKPYYVYMTAGANKFLRIYYARVKECMAKLLDSTESSETVE